MGLWIWSSVLIAVVFYLYWYFKRCYSYWEERGIPYVPPLPFIGSILPMFMKPMHETEIERYEKYGRLYGHYEATRPVINVADPDLLRNILVKDFAFFANRRDFSSGDPVFDKMVSNIRGEPWKRIRTLMSPAFTTGKIKRMISIFVDSANTVCANFEKFAKSGEPVDAKRFFGAFTMDVIASSAFATKVDSHNDPDNTFVSFARQVFSRNVPLRFIMFFLFPSIFKLLKITAFAPGPIKFFKAATLQIIEQRRKTGQFRNDFLQLMMEAADEQKRAQKVEVEEDADEIEAIFKSSNVEKGLSENEVVAQCILFFLAGYDTTASTLSFALYHLALNPDCQEKLIADIDAAVVESKGELTYENVQSMKYLDNVISETLRMCPPAVRLERSAEDDYVLGDTGLVIPKGMIVGIPAYAMHHDPEFYPDPETFNPDRFSPEEKEKRNPYTYLPFGAGPRNCLGMRFALMEIKVCLASFFRRFRAKRIPQTQVPLKYYIGQGLLQPKAILVGIELRKDVH